MLSAGVLCKTSWSKKKVAWYIFNVVQKTLQSIGYTQQINLLDSKDPNLSELWEEVIEMSQFLQSIKISEEGKDPKDVI